MKKRLILVIMAMVMTFAAAISPIYAADMDEIVFELNTLGIMQGDETGDFQLDKPVTRAEFAAIAVRMMNMESLAQTYAQQQGYDDVPINHWANGYIMLLSSMGIINGTGDGKFSPEEYLSYENICKMLVSCLGYSMQAEMSGGYPGGYTVQANNLGLIKNVQASYPFTRQQTAIMVYNALYVKIMTAVPGANGMSYEVSDSTFRDKFSSDVSLDGTIEKREGLVTATIDAYLNQATASMQEDQIEIDNVMYYTNDPNASQYIGQVVTYYVNTDNYNRIISIRPTNDNEVTTIATEDLARVTDTQLTYYFNKVSQKTIKLSTGVTFLKNNRPVTNWTPEDLMDLSSGYLTLINYNSDEDTAVDVILYKEYTSCVVEEVNTDQNMIYFIDNTLLNGKKYVDYDPDRNDNVRTVLYNSDGTKAQVSDVTADSLISFCVSDDGTYVEGIISNQFEEGLIQSADADTITINDTEYPTENESVYENAILDREVKVYINHKGEAAYIKKATGSSQYFGIVSLYTDETGSKNYVKAVLPGKLEEITEEIENESGGDPTIVSKLVCRNSEIKEFPISDKVTYTKVKSDGTSTSVSGIVNVVDAIKSAISSDSYLAVKYRLDNNGEIYRIEDPETIAPGETKVYNSYERTFGKKGGAFGVDFETSTLCIPAKPANVVDYQPSSEDYLVSIEMADSKEYTIKGFDKNESRYTADLIVVKMSMSSGSIGIINTSSKVGFVNDVVNVLNEDGEETVKITMLTQGGVKEFDVADNFRRSDDYIIPPKGSMIVYSQDRDYNLDNIYVVKNFNSAIGVGGPGTAGDYEVFTGYALSADYHHVSTDLNRWVTRLGCSYDVEGTPDTYYEIVNNNTPPIYIYNTRTKTAEYGSIKDAAIGSDMLTIFSSNSTVRAVVIIR